MLSRTDLDTAVFIGGMEGIFVEHGMFVEAHPEAKVIVVPGPGGAAVNSAKPLAVRRMGSAEHRLCAIVSTRPSMSG